MSRNFEKSPFYKNDVISSNNSKKPISIIKKNLIILPEYVDKIFIIYNGKTFTKIKIIEKMIGFKFGEFINTRKRHIYKKKKK